MQEPEHLGRRSIRLKGYDYTRAGGYFVTVVTFQQECLFGEIGNGEMRINALGRIVVECWRAIPEHFPNADVDAFVVMPNHVHGIVFIHENDGRTVASPSAVRAQHAAPLHAPLHEPLRGMTQNVKPGSLGAIVRSFKSAVTRRAGRELDSANIWQRNYYEHIVRNDREYERIAGYILANPVNWNKDGENQKNTTSAEEIGIVEGEKS